MSNELIPEGPELQPDGTGEFGALESGSEDASHLLPPIRELPNEREFVPGLFYAIQAADGSASGTQLGEILGQALFQSLADVHLFGRNAGNEPWLQVGPLTPEPAQLLIAQELIQGNGMPVAQDDLEMFEMIAGRVAKTMQRAKQPPAEDAAAAAAAARAANLAALKGKFADRFGLSIEGQLDVAQVVDCCLSLGMKSSGGSFGWHGGQAMGDALLIVQADNAGLKSGATGSTQRIAISYAVAGVSQPGKLLERAFAAAYYFTKRLGGQVKMLDGSAPSEGTARGEHPALQAIVKKISDAGLKPGHAVTKRLL